MAITTTTTHPPATPHPRSTITAPTTNRNLSQMPRIHSPPPPIGYGQGLPPSNPTSRLPQLANNCPPPSPAPPPNADSSDLYPLFLVANSSHSGSLSESELGSALVNADYSAFDPYTIKMMMRMFSTTPRLDFVTYEEFVDLWRFLAEWRGIFERFDEDRSRIQLSCLCTAELSAVSVQLRVTLAPQSVAQPLHWDDCGARVRYPTSFCLTPLKI